jgi:tetratricopeptide (TPR) repeat protein
VNGKDFDNHVKEIIHHYKRAIEIDSTYLSSLNNLASSYSTFYQDYHSGIFYAKKALQIDSNFTKAHINVAVAYDNLQQPDSAYKYFILSVASDKYSENDYQIVTNFLFKENRVDEGRNDLLRYEKDGPSKAICINIANLYSTDLNYTSESIHYFVKAFEYDNKDVVLCTHIANLYKSINAIEEWEYYTEISKGL